MAYTVAQKIQIAQVSLVLVNNDVAAGALFGKRIDTRLPLMLAMETDSVNWQYEHDPSDSTLLETSDYLYSLCKYSSRARAIINAGGGGQVITPTIPIISNGVNWIRITSADFSNATDYVNTELEGKTFRVFANWIPDYLQPLTQWEYLTGGGVRILIDGFDAQTYDYELYIDLEGTNELISNTVAWDNILGKPQSDVFYDLENNFLVPNRGIPEPNFLLTITIKPNGFSYTWDTQFAFSDNYPEQPTANGNDTIQVYTFKYLDPISKYYCVGQSLNGSTL
jgi:hypothetical protein